MTRRDLIAILPALLLINCGTETAPATPEKPPEPVTGLHALFQMYTQARSWAPDIKVVRLSSRRVPEVKAEAGKAAAWQVLFASDSLGKTRMYTFSVYDESVTLRQGIFPDPPGALSSDIHPFVIGDASVDSDKAWEVAQSHGGKYASEHPDMPISYLLEADPQKGGPVWRVVWGLSTATSEFSVLVDAHTGEYIRSLH